MFDEYRAQPVRRKGTASLLDLDSLIALVTRFKDEDTMVFANDDRANRRCAGITAKFRCPSATRRIIGDTVVPPKLA